jgi:hypothetical protein
MIKQIEDNDFPCLEKFLSSRYAFSSSKYVCEICDYVAKNQSAMSAHKRGCKSKVNNTSILEENTTICNVITQPIIISTEKESPPTEKKKSSDKEKIKKEVVSKK